jgi:hypothetical protein
MTNRSMFSEEIRDKGLDGVIAELHSRNQSAWNGHGPPAGEVAANGAAKAGKN